MDIICYNKYEGWYLSVGDVSIIVHEIVRNVEAWRKKHNKLVMLTEYGADSEEGLHSVSSH